MLDHEPLLAQLWSRIAYELGARYAANEAIDTRVDEQNSTTVLPPVSELYRLILRLQYGQLQTLPSMALVAGLPNMPSLPPARVRLPVRLLRTDTPQPPLSLQQQQPESPGAEPESPGAEPEWIRTANHYKRPLAQEGLEELCRFLRMPMPPAPYTAQPLAITDPLELQALVAYIQIVAGPIDQLSVVPLWLLLARVAAWEPLGLLRLCVLACGFLCLIRRGHPDVDQNAPLLYYLQACDRHRELLLANLAQLWPMALVASMVLSGYELFLGSSDGLNHVHGLTRIMVRMLEHASPSDLVVWRQVFSIIILQDTIVLVKWSKPCHTPLPQYPPLTQLYLRQFVLRTGNGMRSTPPSVPWPDQWWFWKVFNDLATATTFLNMVLVETQAEYENETALGLWEQLYAELQAFEACLPVLLRPVFKSSGTNFPRVLHLNTTAVVVAIQFHLCSLTVYRGLLARGNFHRSISDRALRWLASMVLPQAGISFPEYHARQIVGLLKSNLTNITVNIYGAFLFRKALQCLEYTHYNDELHELCIKLQVKSTVRMTPTPGS